MVHITRVKTRARALRNALGARDAPLGPTSRRYIQQLYTTHEFCRALGERRTATLPTETSPSSSLPLALSLGRPDLSSDAASLPFTAMDFGFHAASVYSSLLFPVSGHYTILILAYIFLLVLGFHTRPILSHRFPFHP